MLLFFFFFITYLRSSFALLISTENRVSTRNITCQHGLASSATFLFNCEACLMTSRNYDIQSALSLTGSGSSGISYACLRVNEVEAYHENLIHECRHFPRDTLNGYDDFCIASPYNFVRGSYRACICLTNACNFNYTQCIRHMIPYWDRVSPLFSNTIMELTDLIKCYRPYEDYKQGVYSSFKPMCSENDNECKNYLFDHGVLCTINADRTNQIRRQTLTPSIYSAYLMKYKTQLCNSFTWTSKNIYFSDCQLEETVCMCAIDGCDKDLQTCRTSEGIYNYHYASSLLLLFVLNIYI